MSEVRLRARSVSEIVDAAFALYRRDAGQYMLIMAVAMVPRLIAQLIWQPEQTTDFISHPEVIMATLLLSVVSVISSLLGHAAIVKYGSDVYLGQPADAARTVRSMVPKIVPILWAGFLVGFLYFAGLLCFFIGVFYVAARYFALTTVIVLEDASVMDAFARSSALSAGRKRHILNTLLLVWIIYFLLSVCVGLVGSLMHSNVVTIMVATLFTIVGAPIIAITNMILYYDCRIRGEGFDIEHMAAAMDRAPAPATP
ncbi:MAG TPA: hypothetical protein VGQ30_08015 [Gemmatimonadaceae bacterium]|jgi:hypothetical protein|nr:hypothetical protein [Gemmatimonadaceae bacterium]